MVPVVLADRLGRRVEDLGRVPDADPPPDGAEFRADPSRGKPVLEDRLGEHRPEFWISDRFGAQKGLARSGHQFCPVHLIRDARYAVDAGDTGFAPGFPALLKNR